MERNNRCCWMGESRPVAYACSSHLLPAQRQFVRCAAHRIKRQRKLCAFPRCCCRCCHCFSFCLLPFLRPLLLFLFFALHLSAQAQCALLRTKLTVEKLREERTKDGRRKLVLSEPSWESADTQAVTAAAHRLLARSCCFLGCPSGAAGQRCALLRSLEADTGHLPIRVQIRPSVMATHPIEPNPHL